MKKAIALIAVLALSLALLSGCGKEKEQLNLYTWEGMFPQEVLDGFEKETGIKVNYVSFDFNETMLAKLEANDASEYDLVIGDDYIIEAVIQEGLAQKLDKDLIRNYGNINPLFQKQYFDPEDAYSVPYGAGIQAIVYSPERAGFEIKSFDDLTDPRLKDKVGLANHNRFIYGASLLEDGESVNCEDPAAIRKAADQVMEMAPNVRLIKESGLQHDLVSGEIAAAVTYTSEVTQACIADPSLKVVYSQKGLGFGVMSQFIPKNAPHAEAAHRFIDYILEPEVSKQCYEHIGYYCTNQAADALIDEQYKPFLTLPEGAEVGKMDMMRMVGPEAQDLHDRLWTQFRNACGA